MTDKGGVMEILVSPKTVGARHFIMGRATIAVGENIARHAHDYGDEALYIVDGRGIIHIEGEDSIDIASGDAVLIPQGHVHSLSNTGSTPLFVVFASGPLAPRPEAGHRNLPTQVQEPQPA